MDSKTATTFIQTVVHNAENRANHQHLGRKASAQTAHLFFPAAKSQRLKK